MFDQIEKIDRSVIQHGKLNDRIYLMNLADDDVTAIAARLVDLAHKNNYTKIFAKVPSNALQYFQKYDFFKEAHIPGFYHGKTGMYFMSKFIEPTRADIPLHERLEIRKIIELTKSKRPVESEMSNPIQPRMLGENDAVALAHLFKSVFKTYPFPIFDVDYIKKTMRNNVRYYGIFDKEKLIAASAAEISETDKNVEMTDFAVSPLYRAKNLALQLLQEMEKDIFQSDIKTLYSIVRALSPAMNITFAKAGYYFAGTLKNNTNIGGHIESMNVWYKTQKVK